MAKQYDTTGATVGAAGHDAAAIIAAGISAGVIAFDSVLEEYATLTKSIVSTLLEIQGVTALETGVSATPAERAPRSSAPRSSGGGNAGTTELRGGKYAGKTVNEVIDLDREYAEWFAEHSENEFMAKKFAEALQAA